MISKVSFGEYLSFCLRSLDVHCIYTLPGDLTLELLSSLELNGLKLYCFPDEESVITAADFHANLSGLSIVVCSDGYSLAKMINPLIASRLRYSQVVLLTVSYCDDRSNSSDLNMHPQPTRVQYMCNSIGIDTCRLSESLSVQTFVNLLSRPLATHQPFVLEVAPDLISSSLWLNHGKLVKRQKTSHRTNDLFDLSCLPTLNTESNRIVIFGNALNQYRSQYLRLLLKKQFIFDYLVMPSVKGLINEDDERYLGTYLGDFSSDHILKALSDADQIILIGVQDFEMAWSSYKFYSGKSGWNLKTEFLELGKQLLTIDSDKYSDGDDIVFHDFSLLESFFDGADFVSQDNLTSKAFDNTGFSFYDKITSALSTLRNSAFIVDVGISTLTLFNIHLSACSTFISNPVWSNMGTAFAAGVAVSSCLLDQKIWIVVGDGSAIMSMHDLSVFVRYNIDVRIIILDNKGYLSEKIKHTGTFNDGFYVNWTQCAQSMGFETCLKCDSKEDIFNMIYTLASSESKQSLLWVEIPPYEFPDSIRSQVEWTLMKRRMVSC